MQFVCMTKANITSLKSVFNYPVLPHPVWAYPSVMEGGKGRGGGGVGGSAGTHGEEHVSSQLEYAQTHRVVEACDASQ